MKSVRHCHGTGHGMVAALLSRSNADQKAIEALLRVKGCSRTVSLRVWSDIDQQVGSLSKSELQLGPTAKPAIWTHAS